MATISNEIGQNYQIDEDANGVTHRNLQLLESVRHSDVHNVRQLLECGADPDFELFVDQVRF